jgi:site-specific recombinase XerD
LRRYVQVPTPDEIQKLLKTFNTRAPTGARNMALVVVLWRSGLRIGEALALLPKDLDARHYTIQVRRGAGARRRFVAVNAEAWSVLDRWLDKRHTLGIPGGRPVFCTLRGEPLSPEYVRAMLRRKASRAGIDRIIRPHGLRHAFASELAAEGQPPSVIRDALGHSSLATTEMYLRDVSPERLITVLRARRWAPEA